VTSRPPQKILILGGAGFIGAHLAARFVGAGCAVGVVDGLVPGTGGRRENLDSLRTRLAFFVDETVESLRESGGLREPLAWADCVIDAMARTAHLEGFRSPVRDLELNLLSHAHVVEELPEGRCLVYLGSRSQYGTPPGDITEDTPCEPRDPQGVAKLAAERLYQVFAERKKLRGVSLRLGNVFGPLQSTRGEVGLVGEFVQTALQGEPIAVYDGVGRRRNLSFVEDVAEAVFRATTVDWNGFEILNLGGFEIEIADLARQVVELCGRGSVVPRPMPAEIRAIDPGGVHFDDSRFRARTGLPSPPFAPGALRQTIDHFRSELDLPMIHRCRLVPQLERFEGQILRKVREVLHSGTYLLGEETRAFEEEFARAVGVCHGIAVANGTDGLMLAMQCLGVEPGDEVVTTPFTAIATYSAIVAVGARPVFVDVDPDTFLMDLAQVAAAVTPRTRAVMPVHLFGSVVDVAALRRALPRPIPVIEDACQAHGSSLRGAQAGSMGECGVFSFYPTKNLGAYGDGGMIVTSDDVLAADLESRRMYGMVDRNHIDRDGINSRIDELQSAILRIKLRALEEMNARRRELAARYEAAMPRGWMFAQGHTPGVTPNHHVYVVRVTEGRDALVSYLADRRIQTNVYYPVPLHLQVAAARWGIEVGTLPVVEKLCGEVIALPMYPELPIAEQDRVIEAICDFARERGFAR
jgi:dTDP-4-amino-4,6-dideoxygalactose transaminase/nucleoside-diphosphate-sugar epimerase